MTWTKYTSRLELPTRTSGRPTRTLGFVTRTRCLVVLTCDSGALGLQLELSNSCLGLAAGDWFL